MSIGDNIKFLRESKNLTQIEFGKIAGVSDKAVSTWENGTAEPRMGAIQRIADYFGVSKGWIVDDTRSSSSESDQTDNLFIDRYGKAVYEAAMMYASLDEVDRGKVTERMSILLEADKYKKVLTYGEKAI
ncbi:MAG: helix-turn-helix transcriptional regulator [Mogibacterium sp.]|nr:helix-turn-helix transcriptional regulator [Mogibacterium sp.]